MGQHRVQQLARCNLMYTPSKVSKHAESKSKSNWKASRSICLETPSSLCFFFFVFFWLLHPTHPFPPGWIETFHIHDAGDFFLVVPPLQYFRVIQKFCCYLTYRRSLSARLSQSWGFYCVPLECFSSTYLCQKRGPRPSAHTRRALQSINWFRRRQLPGKWKMQLAQLFAVARPPTRPDDPAARSSLFGAPHGEIDSVACRDPQVNRKINLQM